MALTADQVQKFYIGYYARPADPVGLTYWQTQDEAAALKGFSGSDEFTKQFTGLSASQQVTKVYNNLLGRAPDAAGLLYWAGELTAGRETIGTLVLSMTKNALGKDVTTIEDRVSYSKSFTAALDTPAEINAYAGAAATQTARTALLKVVANSVGDHTALNAEVKNIDATVATIVSGGSGGATPGQTFTLTVGADTLDPNAGNPSFKTTAGDDVIRAVTALSFETIDAINGGEGNDTLNVGAGSLVVAGARPVLKSVETINITSNLATDILNLADSTGVNAINVTSTNAASVVTVNNIATLDTVIGTGLSTAAGIIDVDFVASTAGSADTLKVALGNNNGNIMTIQSTADTDTFEAISIAANGSKSGTSVAGNNAADAVVFNNAHFNTVKTITVTGNGNSDITSASVALTTVTATAANGNNTYTFAGAAGKTVSTGTGNDTIITGAGNDTVNAGDGNDTISAAAGTNIYNGGAGADTYTGGGTDTFIIQTSTIEDLGFDTVSAAGFTSGTDILKFVGGPAATATNYVEATTAGTGFVSARSAALTQLAGNTDLKYVAIDDAAGDTYVFFDGNGDHQLATNGADFVVKLTGVTIAGVAFGDIIAG